MVVLSRIEELMWHQLARIEKSADDLEQQAREEAPTTEDRDLRLASAAGARAYARGLRRDLERGNVRRSYKEIQMVADAADYVWLSTDIIDACPDKADTARRLVAAGVLGVFPAVPRFSRACHRLIAPQ